MPAPWIQTVLIELSKKLNHYWYSEPRTWKTCLFYIVLRSHDTNRKILVSLTPYYSMP